MTSFDESVDFFDRMRQSEWGRRVMEEFIAFIGPRPSWTALDIGCGAGNLSLTLASRVARVEGIDVSPRMVERAREKCAASTPANCAFRVARAEELPYAEVTFDLATTSSVLYLVSDQPRAAEEMARVTRSGGLVALHEPTPLMTPARMDRHLEERRAAGEDVSGPSGWARAAVSHSPLTEERVVELFEPHGLRFAESRRRMEGMVLEAKLLRR
ncbi:MAG: class I SAM-dependent methyltransferase [Coriobacteriia bacterium]|nr:class I SAM-dependent methyltransferase [Coriobacteriia bacterium]